MKQLNWGIIGAGRIAQQFAADIALVDNAHLYAIAARELSRAQAFAADYQAEQAYGSYEQLLDDPKLDAVYIATPHNLHFEQAKAAILAGKSVLCEKPFTISPLEAQTLFELAQREQVYLMEGMWTYFLPAIQKAKAWVEQGRIGKLRHIKADFGYPIEYHPRRREYDVNLAGGALFEMGIYPIALTHLFCKQAPQSLQVDSTLAQNGVEDDVCSLQRFGDVKAMLGTSFKCRLGNKAYLIGEQGYIVIPDFFRASECALYQIDECLEEFSAPHQGHGFEYEIAAVTDEILQGKLTCAVVTPEDTLAFQQRIAEMRALCLC
ncbi:Gfo/Idh/MocA family oxidoreductase [Shewanella sp. WXL01]|uniref:Gfo/Idh/MocA family protein n=1 Tax=Shewanella sp. WXL01 TaxID=2709721 RepID=UPI0014382F0D|nr:Gfo/Idh/MocA family oxidoreductase [Shewanella sp. WXL01]NKF51404.1 Gfo/Idh/MocA family oxidoreductase [Shewanella sp. WXL01]